MRTIAVSVIALVASVSHVSSQAGEPTREDLINMVRSLQARVEALEKREAHRPAKPQTERYAAVQAPAPLPVIAVEAKSASAAFEGFYLGALAGYGFSHYPKGQTQQTPFSTFFFPSPLNLQGANLGVAAGYNVGAGPLLVGLEGRAKTGSESTRTTNLSTFERSFPFTSSFACCTAPLDPNPFPPLPFDVRSTGASKDVLQNRGSAEILGRLGFVFWDTLIFGKAGVGVQALRYAETTAFQNTRCIAPIVERRFLSLNFAEDLVIGCSATVVINTVGVSDKAQYVLQPFVSVGGGIERNFGPFFARLEGAMLTHLPTVSRKAFGIYDTPVYYSTEVNGVIGYRF